MLLFFEILCMLFVSVIEWWILWVDLRRLLNVLWRCICISVGLFFLILFFLSVKWSWLLMLFLNVWSLKLLYLVGILYWVIFWMVVLLRLWYLIKLVMVLILRLCFLVNFFSFGWWVIVLFLLRIFIIILVGFNFVKCGKFILVLVWFVWFNMLLFLVISGKIWFGCIMFVVFVFFVIVVLMVVVWFVVEMFVVMLVVVLIDIVKLVENCVLFLFIISGRFRVW